MIKAALVGAGFIGKAHAQALKQINGLAIVAVVEKIEEKGKILATELGAEYFSNLDELFKNIEFDFADICVPTFLHHDFVLKVINKGKHVFCEKPLTLSLKEADEMVEAAKTKKIKAMVGHSLRFWPEYVKIKEYVESGILGNPINAFCERLAVTPDWHQDNWGASEKYSGGAALDLHIHDLDYLIWLFGKPILVKASGSYDPTKKEQSGLVHIFTSLEFKNGVAGFAEGGWRFKGTFPFTMIIRILCEKGTVEWIFRAGKNIEERNKISKIIVYKDDGSVENIEAEQKDAFLNELNYFVDCITKDKPVKNATFTDGRTSLEVALAAIKSVKDKSAIVL
ncbi:MAG: Gfo/Idh/MocA family oxidoreductase [Actinomycetota bacterium]|nr:Gfo/Idh/MocA family oxidoreductase [Actinomycetota bacterium]